MASSYSPSSVQKTGFGQVGLGSTKRKIDMSESQENEASEKTDESPSKRIKLNESPVHKEFDYKESLNPKTNKFEKRSCCRHCSVSYIGKNPSNLWNHLEKKHKSVYKRVKESDDRTRDTIKAEAIVSTSKSASNLETRESALLGKWVNASPRLAQLAPQSKQEEEDSLRAIAVWIGSSTVPQSVVDDPGFKNVLKSFDIRVC